MGDGTQIGERIALICEDLVRGGDMSMTGVEAVLRELNKVNENYNSIDITVYSDARIQYSVYIPAIGWNEFKNFEELVGWTAEYMRVHEIRFRNFGYRRD